MTSALLRLNDKMTLEDAFRDLLSVERRGNKHVVDMPVVTYGGSRVQVCVEMAVDAKHAVVSDDGMAMHQTDAAAIPYAMFARVAREKAMQHGARFDGGSVFFFEVPIDRVRGAIIAMAELIREVVNTACERAAQDRGNTLRDALYSGLEDAFGASRVAHQYEVVGYSNADYRVDAMVESDSGPVVFDLFSRHPNSIAAIYTKFSDIRQLEAAPRLVAATRDVERVGPKLTLVSSVSRVIAATSPRERLLRLVA